MAMLASLGSCIRPPWAGQRLPLCIRRRNCPPLFPHQVVAAYNADPAVHGILVQLPLPKHINEQRILDAISIEKDVDGGQRPGGRPWRGQLALAVLRTWQGR